jgi:hypothetical protein
LLVDVGLELIQRGGAQYEGRENDPEGNDLARSGRSKRVKGLDGLERSEQDIEEAGYRVARCEGEH